MPDFEWSPEAIDRIYRRLDGGTFGTTSKDCIKAVLHAAEAQPVVALPPCPTCNGRGWDFNPHLGRHGEYEDLRVPCPACNGSGVERMVPLSEIVAEIRKAAYRIEEASKWKTLAGGWREAANMIEQKFGGKHAD